MSDANLAAIQSALSGFGECAHSLKKETGYEAASGSRKEQESTEVDAFHIGRAYACAFMMLVAAEDHLQSLSRLLGEVPITQFGLPVIARSALENSAKAGWILDETVDAQQRLARGFTIWLSSLYESKEVLELDGHAAGVERDAKELEASIKAAEEMGLTIVEDRFGRCSVKEAQMPSSTSLCESLLRGTGKAAFKRFSASTHGTTYALLDNYDFKSASEGQLVKPQISLAMIATICSTAGAAFALAFGRQVILYGWDNEVWSAWSSHALGVFLSPMKDYIDANPLPDE